LPDPLTKSEGILVRAILHTLCHCPTCSGNPEKRTGFSVHPSLNQETKDDTRKHCSKTTGFSQIKSANDKLGASLEICVIIYQTNDGGFRFTVIAIINYGMGNIRSVEKAFTKVGVPVIVTERPEEVQKADGVVLPGVGAFRDCMRELNNLSLIDAVVESLMRGKPYLGICLGLQVLFTESEEFGRCRGLGILKGSVKRFQTIGSCPGDGTGNMNLKVPHIGWNQLRIMRDNPLLKGITDMSYFYFVHSYYVIPEDESIISTVTGYGIEFTSMIWKDNIYAVQFHPEKSQLQGLQILKNFGDIVKASANYAH